jgi:hypothetical protein
VQSGNGAFSFSLIVANVGNDDSIQLTDTDASLSGDPITLVTATNPVLDASGPILDTNYQPTDDSEELNVSGAIPSEPVELYLDGTLDSAVTQTADSYGDAAFSLTGLTPGYQRAYAVAEDSSGNPADGSTIHFTTEPVISGASAYYSYVNTSTPTVTLTGVAFDVGSIDAYTVAQNGTRTQVPDGDYGWAPGANNTATVSFTTFDPSATYVFTQTDHTVQSDPDSIPGVSFTVNTAAPSVYPELQSSVTNDTQPTFVASINGTDDSTFDVEYTLAQNGQTVASSGAVAPQNEWQVPNALADGTYSVTAVTVDEFGEMGTNVSAPATFTVDTVPPAAPTFTSPTAGATVTSKTPTVTVQTGDSDGDSVYLCVDDPNAGNCDYAQADTNGVATFALGTDAGTTPLTAGQHTLQATTYDEAGNSTSTSITINVSLGTTTTPTTTTPTTTTTTTTTPTPAPTEPTTNQVTSSLNNALGKVSGKSATTAAVVKSGGVTLSFTAPSAGTVTIDWYATIKGKKVLIGSVTKTLGASGKAGLKVKLNSAGKKLLKGSKKSVKITESGSFTPQGGKKSTTSKTLKLKG